MRRVTRSYIEGHFGQIHLRVASPPRASIHPPLHCLHQSPKCGLEFETFMREMSADRIVVAADYPGYGQSDAPPSERLATVPSYAEACWQVADALGHDRIDLFGNHTGAKVAAEMTLQHPDRVGALAMVSAAILTPAERAAFLDYFTPIPLDAAGTRFTTMWQRIIERRGRGVPLELLATSLSMNLLGGEAYEWGHVAAFAYDEPFVRALQTLPHPITILNPGDDLQQATRRAEGLMRRGEIIECPQWGYNFMDMAAADVAALLRPRLSPAS